MRRARWLILGMLLLILGLAGTLLAAVSLMRNDAAPPPDRVVTRNESGGTASVTGRRLYARSCAACHGADGTGRPGTFPPLVGHVPAFTAPEGGRDYLIDVLLYGLSGPIEADGTTYRGFMPPVSRLDDQQIADVLNYSLGAWGNAAGLPGGFEPLEADEVSARRGRELGPADIHARRQRLMPVE